MVLHSVKDSDRNELPPVNRNSGMNRPVTSVSVAFQSKGDTPSASNSILSQPQATL